MPKFLQQVTTKIVNILASLPVLLILVVMGLAGNSMLALNYFIEAPYHLDYGANRLFVRVPNDVSYEITAEQDFFGVRGEEKGQILFSASDLNEAETATNRWDNFVSGDATRVEEKVINREISVENIYKISDTGELNIHKTYQIQNRQLLPAELIDVNFQLLSPSQEYFQIADNRFGAIGRGCDFNFDFDEDVVVKPTTDRKVLIVSKPLPTDLGNEDTFELELTINFDCDV